MLFRSDVLDSGVIPRGPGSWRNCLRMEQRTFDMILQKVAPLIQKNDTNFRRCISPAERLAVTLRCDSTFVIHPGVYVHVI